MEPSSDWSKIPKPPSESEWPEIKARFPAGASAQGVVVGCFRFGAFIDLGGGALGLMEVPYLPWHEDDEQVRYPDVGEPLAGIVVGHTDHNRQVRLQAPDPWIKHQR